MTLFLKKGFLIIFIFLLSNITIAQNKGIDSLKNELSIAVQDTIKYKLLGNISLKLSSINQNEAKKYASEALIISKKIDDKLIIATSYNRLGVIENALGNYDEAYLNYDNAIKILESEKSQPFYVLYVETILNKGIVYLNQGEHEKSLSILFKSLKGAENINDKIVAEEKMAAAYTNIANVFFHQQKLDEALKYFLKSLELSKKNNNQSAVATTLGGIGIVYGSKNELDKAAEYFIEQSEINEVIGNKQGAATAIGNLGIVYTYQGKLEKALECQLKSLEYGKELDDKRLIAYGYNNIGQAHFALANRDKAIDYMNKSLELAIEMKLRSLISDNYKGMADIYKNAGQYDLALEYLTQYIAIKDTLFNEKSNKQITEMQTKYETEKKETENKLLTKDNALKDAQLNRQQLITFGVGIVLVLALGLTVLIFISYKRKKKNNLLLERKNIAIENQKNEIENKNRLITDSIDYAKDIQDAIMPLISNIKKVFADAFIFYQPKDVVSGDFYWFYESKNHVYLSAIDCTGHGVPGAFMSLMGYNLIEKIVKQQKITQPSKILDVLNVAVLKTLKQENDENSAKYGMDMSLVKIEKETKKLEYAGAHNSLFIVRDNNLSVIKADKVAIGTKRQMESNFTNHQFQLKNDDVIYLYSDGYADQLGGPKRKRYYSSKLMSLLTDISKSSMEMQQETLQQTFNDWKGNIEQLDDLLIIGAKI